MQYSLFHNFFFFNRERKLLFIRIVHLIINCRSLKDDTKKLLLIIRKRQLKFWKHKMERELSKFNAHRAYLSQEKRVCGGEQNYLQQQDRKWWGEMITYIHKGDGTQTLKEYI